jgi:hypothetical protein
MAFTPPDRMAGILQSAKPQAGTEGYSDEWKLYGELSGFAAKREKALEDDPAAYVRSNPAVKTFEDSLSLQGALGVSPERQRVLTKAEASGFVGKFNAMPAEDRVQAMNQLADSSGKHFDLVFRDLVEAKLSPENHVLLSLRDNPSAAAVTPVLAEAIKLGPQELRKNIPAADLKAVDEGVNEALSEYMNTVVVADTTGEQTQFVNQIKNVVGSVALVYYRKGISGKHGLTGNEAAKLAADQIVNSRYHPIDGTYAIPKRFNEAFTRDNLRETQQNIDQAQFDFRIPSSSNAELKSDQLRSDYLNAIKRNGFWATNPDETGVILYDHAGNPVHNTKGGFFEIRFQDAEKSRDGEQQGMLPVWDSMGTGGTPLDAIKGQFGEKSMIRKAIPQELKPIVNKAAEKHGVPADLIERVLMQESAGDPKAQSSAGAQGLMQLMPSTAADLGVSDPFDPNQSVDGGTKYLASLLKRYGGDRRKALAAYNWGMGNVDKWDGKLASLPKETRDYLSRILG